MSNACILDLCHITGNMFFVSFSNMDNLIIIFLSICFYGGLIQTAVIRQPVSLSGYLWTQNLKLMSASTVWTLLSLCMEGKII